MEDGVKENDELSVKMTKINKELASSVLSFDSSKLIDAVPSMQTLVGLIEAANIFAQESSSSVYMSLNLKNLIVAFNCDEKSIMHLKNYQIEIDQFELRAGGNILDAFLPYDYNLSLKRFKNAFEQNKFGDLWFMEQTLK